MGWLGFGSNTSSQGDETDAAYLRKGREACYQARDAFYSCCEDSGAPFSTESPHPKACDKARKFYKGSCQPSWVKHFDRLKDKEVRVVRVLHDNINQRATESKGSLGGENLQK